MSRILRIQLANLAEAWLRAQRPDMSRERAADLISDWPLALPWDDDTVTEVLSRFPETKQPVPGRDFLAEAKADAATLVAETVAALDEPKATGSDDPWAGLPELLCLTCGHLRSVHWNGDGISGAGCYADNCLCPVSQDAIDEVVPQPTADARSCCDDHGNICGVVEYAHAACCDECPEFGGQS